ncbi:E2 [Gammapapillomavirus 13]|uniref:Regulatory protein E2 n=1 Tax=Gammapapillomavirus 13 TaxID=1513258 RepID=A0A2D2ALR5_9PAPI|nr:E2 [Gammapapillomavirus 13]
MNQADLTRRFDALQDELLTLIESGSDDLSTQIRHWELNRKINVTMYYGRKEGYKNFGLQQLPAPQVSEYNAKLAITMQILLKSLATSQYKSEPWSLTDTSTEVLLTPPKNCFKKFGYQVKVTFDDDPDNYMLYTNWDAIYYQDLQDIWHKVPGGVDHNGLYYDDVTGERNYFLLFQPEAERYGKSGIWTVQYKNTTLSSIVTSSSKYSSAGYSGEYTADSGGYSSPEEGTSRRSQEASSRSSGQPTSTSEVGRRRRKQGESGTERSTGGVPRKRQRPTSAPSPEEVGGRHQSLPRTGLSRLRRLEEEARDPPLLLIKGPPNTLKCWRFRCNNRCGHLFTSISTVFKWTSDDYCNNPLQANGRMLISFKDLQQRQKFITHVNFPRHTSYALGSVDSL